FRFFIRNARIEVEHRPQGLSQRVEPSFIASPAFETGAIEWLPHLPGARRENRPRVLVEAQAGLVEWQAEMIQEPSDLPFEIVHQLLVQHTVNAAGPQAIEMRHRLYVVAEVAAELLEARAEIDRATEVLGEGGDAPSHGLPPDVGDPGVRQGLVDEPDPGPVAGPLVREERAIRPAAGADGREISLPPRAQGTGIQ